MRIVGISAYYHDSAAAFIEDGAIVAAAQEERFTRKKHDAVFPRNALAYCLEEAGVRLGDVDAIAFYEKPLLKFERLLETYYAHAPMGLPSFIAAMPVWLKEKMFLRRLLKKELKRVSVLSKATAFLFPEHHVSHAASAFYPSPYEDAAILTIDGVGEWATATIGRGTGNKIELLRELRFPHSVGLLYSAFAYYLGFRVNSGEYKLMGLAPYGNPGSDQVEHYKDRIRQNLLEVFDDGSIWLNQKMFSYSTGLRMVNDKKWERLFGFPRREPDTGLLQHHCDLALAIQQLTEDIVLKMTAEAKRLTGAANLCLAGGVALNSVANGKIERSTLFDNTWIQPAAGDAGGAVGAALAAYHVDLKHERVAHSPDAMSGAQLGPEFSFVETSAQSRVFPDFGELCDHVARLLDARKVIGWYQERMEFGPRALGNRSIVADPRDPEMQRRLNLKVKFRESFRPFAPAVLQERAGEYFEDGRLSPYMLMVKAVKEEHRLPISADFANWSMDDKLYAQQSDLPAVTHVDNSARVQTVSRQANDRFWQLLKAWERLTGCGALINTSFNVRGEPIVCTPADALSCFERTEMDYLVINNTLISKA